MMDTEKKQTSKWSNRKLFLYSLITLFFLLLLLEIGFRIAFYFHYRGLHTTVFVQGSPLQCSDSLLIYKNQPFYVGYENYQNNEEGMRSMVGDIFIPKKTNRDFWILLTGASAMEGMGSNRNGLWIDITGVEDHPYNESIAYFLQNELQRKMPDKKIHVFNAATSGYTAEQSYLRYRSLEGKLRPDWVISMDGANEPSKLTGGQSTRELVKKGWKDNPQFHYPLKLIVSMTRHSALINALKQKLFHSKQKYRIKKQESGNFPQRTIWARAAEMPLRFEYNSEIETAVQRFETTLETYDSTLTAKHVPHLLFIQPHISRRNVSKLEKEEKAVSNYYRSTFQNTAQHQFFNLLYTHYSKPDGSHASIVPMNAVHTWKGWVFVDYCHFTKTANKRIAAEISEYITSGGIKRPFQ